MNLKDKKGITVTSIVVYVILFFLFTTTTSVISTRFNKSLFEDRGNAINITEINKLEYNLLNSSNESYNFEDNINNEVSILKFSNSDVYKFDKGNHVIYKNGGILVKFVKDYSIHVEDNFIKIEVTLNKYTNEVTRTINLNVDSKINDSSYVSSNILLHFDGINNTGEGYHDSSIRYWKDISPNSEKANFNSVFTNDGVNDGWTKNGVLFPQASTTYELLSNFQSKTNSIITVEFCFTVLSELTNGGGDYVYPVRLGNSAMTLSFATRSNVRLMYGFGNNTVFSDRSVILKDKTYTLTFVQENLTTRTSYINGVLVSRMTGLSLQNIVFDRIYIRSHSKGAYIVHDVRVYDKALNSDEILNNYLTDKHRYAK